MTDCNIVTITADEYRELVENAQRGTMIASAIFDALHDFDGFVSADGGTVADAFRIIYPEDYQIWKEEQEEKRRKVGEEAPQG